MIKNNVPSKINKPIRLLACSDIKTAIEVSKRTTNPFYASDGWVEINIKGEVASENPFYSFAGGKKTEESLAHVMEVEGEVVRLGGSLGKIGDNIINSVVVDIRKFSEYALTNPTKTGLFIDSWGYKLADADNLLTIYKNQAIEAIGNGKVVFSKITSFGLEYKIETTLNTPQKGTVKIIAGWMVKNEKLDELLLSSPFVDWVK